MKITELASSRRLAPTKRLVRPTARVERVAALLVSDSVGLMTDDRGALRPGTAAEATQATELSPGRRGAQRPGASPESEIADDTPEAAATEVRRGVISLARRLRLERNEVGLTALELSVLGHLHRRGPLTPGELATAERVQPQSLTRTLTALEAGGLVSRQSDPADGRRSLLAITEYGHAALRTEMQQRDAWLAGAMAAELTTTEIGLLRLAGSLLERLAAANP